MTSKRAEIEPFLVMEILAKAMKREAQGQHIIHMEVGQPANSAPKAAIARVQEHLDEPLGYTLSLGRDDLRAAIAKSYQDNYGLNIAAERVILTTGSSTAFQLAFLALLDKGARVGIAEPGYPSYRNILKALDLQPIAIETQMQNGFQPLASDIDGKKMDAVLIASPANPTGSVLKRHELSALIARAESENIPFISDEIYHGLTYEERAISALEISQDSIVINSFSKYYAMTGWRLGWMIVPENLVRVFEPLAQNLFICPPHISQIAALGALNARAECEEIREVYARNRAHLAQALPRIGLSKFVPANGGFYYYIDVSDYCTDSKELVEIWLDYGVACTPGWDFDPNRGGDYIRLSYARSEDEIAEGIARLTLWASERETR